MSDHRNYISLATVEALEKKLARVEKELDACRTRETTNRKRIKELERACGLALHYFDLVEDKAPWIGILMGASDACRRALETDAT